MCSFVSLHIFWMDVAVWRELSARLPISFATILKPRPASPARAASMEAFQASKFVWLVISRICFAISSICVSDCKLTIAS